MFKSSLIFILLILFSFMKCASLDKLPKYIKNNGYSAETHKIVTEDGYILRTYRIPHGKLSNKTNENAVLLVHGLASTSEHYTCLGPDDALAFLLVDRGFDVWLFNARGTIHSRRHKTKSPNFLQASGFWNFSWHEIGVYDLAANIDYILQNTSKPFLYYVGHSQGGTSYFVLTSEKPEYNRKIRAASLLAPATLMGYTESTMMKFATKFDVILERIAKVFNYYELVIPNNTILNNILKWFCTSSSDFMEACRDILSFIGGQDSGLINVSLMTTIADCTPSGYSAFQPLHYSQLIKSGQFRQYDFGKTTNLVKYNSTVPPDYNLNNSVAPVALFMANGDNLISIKSVQALSKVLPNVQMLYEVPYDNFNHLDYIFAHNAKEMVYEPLYDFLMQYVNK